MRRIRYSLMIAMAASLFLVASADAWAPYGRPHYPNFVYRQDNQLLIRCGSCGAICYYGQYRHCPRCGNFFPERPGGPHPYSTWRPDVRPRPYYVPAPPPPRPYGWRHPYFRRHPEWRGPLPFTDRPPYRPHHPFY
jgi:hypothetical protein